MTKNGYILIYTLLWVALFNLTYPQLESLGYWIIVMNLIFKPLLCSADLSSFTHLLMEYMYVSDRRVHISTDQFVFSD